MHSVFSESAKGVVLPSTPFYVNNVGGGPIFLGLWYLHLVKVFIGSVAIFIVGSILYCFAYLDNGVDLVISRFLLGLVAGTLSAVHAYIAEISTPKQITTYIARASAVQFFGFAITPIIGSTFQLLPPFFIIPPVSVNTLTSPGWCLTIFDSVLLLMLIFKFSDPIKSNLPISEIQIEKSNSDIKLIIEKDKNETTIDCSSSDSSISSSDTSNLIKTRKTSIGNDQKSLLKILIEDRNTLKSLIVFIILNFLVRGILGIFETLGTPIYLLLLNNYDDGSAGYYFGGMGIVGILILLGISYMAGSLGRIIGPLNSGMMFTDTLNCYNVFLFSTCLALIVLLISMPLIPKKYLKYI
ncbi:hypothetical protein ACTFIV_005839 [Dictyostelium citrinum]